jgi:hypothetical protein
MKFMGKIITQIKVENWLDSEMGRFDVVDVQQFVWTVS